MSSIVDERGFNQGFRLNRSQRVRIRRRAVAIASEMHGAKTGRILELGCGTGELAFELVQLTQGEVTGVDLSHAFIGQARTRYVHPRLRFEMMDLTKLPTGALSSGYDYIVGNGILHHLYNQLDELFPTLKELLARSGKLIFWEPNLFNPYVLAIFTAPVLRHLARLEPSEMAFTPHFIVEKLAHAGFSKSRAVPRDFLIPPTPSLLVDAVVRLSDRLEEWPLVRFLAQSVFVTATKPEDD